MAIKVNGTTVINDSRVLENVTGFKNVGGQSILGNGNISVGVSADHGTITQTTVGGVSTATFDLGTGTFFKHTLPSPADGLTSQTFAFTEALTSTQGGSWQLNIDAAAYTDNWRLDNYNSSSDLSLNGLSSSLTATINKQGTQVLERTVSSYPTYGSNGNSNTYNLNTLFQVKTTTTAWNFTSTTTTALPSISLTFPDVINSWESPSWNNAAWAADGKALYLLMDAAYGMAYYIVTLYLNTGWDLTTVSSATITNISSLLSPLNTTNSYYSWIVHSNGTKLTALRYDSPTWKLFTYTLSTPYSITTVQANPVETALPTSLSDPGGSYRAFIRLANNDQHVYLGMMRFSDFITTYHRYNLPSNSANNITSITTTGLITFQSGSIGWNWLFDSNGSFVYVIGFSSVKKRSASLIQYKTIVWPNNITWPRETTAPTIQNTTKQINILTFDGGTTYTGYYGVVPSMFTPKIRIRYITSSTTYTVSSDVAMLEIIATGSGGAGGTITPPGSGSSLIFARGGGAGAGAHFYLTTLSSSYTITLGARGRPAYYMGVPGAAQDGGLTTIVDANNETICSLPGGYSQPFAIQQYEDPGIYTNGFNSVIKSGTVSIANKGYYVTGTIQNTMSSSNTIDMAIPAQILNTINQSNIILPQIAYYYYDIISGTSGCGAPSLVCQHFTPGRFVSLAVGADAAQGTDGLSDGCGGSGAAARSGSTVPYVSGGSGGQASVTIVEYLK